MSSINYFPTLDPDRRTAEAAVVEVTLLEDRAQVTRRGKLEVVPGLNRFLIREVAPVIQDLSLQLELSSGPAKPADLKVRRAMRVKSENKPDDIRRIEEEIEQIQSAFTAISEDRSRAETRQARLTEVLQKGAAEIPEDAGWGMINDKAWRETFEALFKRTRELDQEVLRAYFQQQRLARRLEQASLRRRVADRPDTEFVAWLELDLLADTAGSVELSIRYVVPNAVWRPLHAAKLDGSGMLEFTASAAVWQNTGEDWRQVELSFSTARSSLGTEPPLLSDDLLSVQRRSEAVVVQARQVAIQKAGLGGGGGARAGTEPSSVELPGVDDGGEVRLLKAAGRCTLISDGRPNIVPLFQFEAPAKTSLVLFPELDDKAFTKVTTLNSAKAPILAGPVELIRDNGVVGWTKVLFVAPGEDFELGFGPDDAIRAARQIQRVSELDPIDRWTVTVSLIRIYLSHLGGDPKTLEVIERIPVSEIEQVRVAVLNERSEPKPELDANGMCTWRIPLEHMARRRVQLTYSVATAPGVQGI